MNRAAPARAEFSARRHLRQGQAVYLGTEVVVMSARPGRILERLSLGYSRASAERDDIRSIKASPDFVATRERILGLIWTTPG